MRTCVYDNIEPMRREFWCDRMLVAAISREELRMPDGRLKSYILGCREWADFEPMRTSGDVRALPEGYHAMCGTYGYALCLASLAMHDFIDTLITPVMRWIGAK